MKPVLRLSLALGALFTLPAALAAPVRGGELKYGRYADSLFLDPVYTDANLDIWILTNVYDTLIEQVPGTNKFRGALASQYAFSADGKTFTLTLRPGAKFSNGKAVTASDVKFSLDRARHPEHGAWNFLLNSIAQVSTKGNSQVILKLKAPDPSLVAALSTFNSAILPQSAYNAVKAKDDQARAKAFAEKPIGSGPFVVKEWKRGSYMVLKRNPYYWKKAPDGQPLPYLDGLRFEILPDDNTRILKLQSGELDGAEFIPFARVAELQGNAQLNMKLFPSTRRNFIVLNTRPKLGDGSANPLSNLKLRQALNYATDKAALIKLVAFGNGKESKSFLASSTPLYAAQTAYPFNLAKAAQLLKESGVPTNTPLTLQIIAGNADQIALATALQQMWGAAGVKLNIEQLESATANARYADSDFQMQFNYWTDDIADPNESTAYAAVYKNSQSFQTGFRSTQVDQLFARSQVELNPAKRASLYAQIQALHMAAAPMIFLYEQPFPVALRRNVRDFIQTPLGTNLFVNTYLQK